MTDDVTSILKVSEGRLKTVRDIQFADIEKQGFMPVQERQKITDELHKLCSFRTDYQVITKPKMKEIQKKVNGEKALLYFRYRTPNATTPVSSRIVALFFFTNCQRRDYI